MFIIIIHLPSFVCTNWVMTSPPPWQLLVHVLYIVLIIWDVKPFWNFFFTSILVCSGHFFLLLRLLLVWLLVMENGERLVRHRWRTEFMCLSNMNKRGISTHYHLRGLVSTTTCCLEKTAPVPVLMEKVCRVSGNGQWRITWAPGCQQRQHLFPVHGSGTGRNGDQWRHTVHGMGTTDNGAWE